MTSCQCVLLTSGGVCLLDATAAYTAPVTTTITTTTTATAAAAAATTFGTTPPLDSASFCRLLACLLQISHGPEGATDTTTNSCSSYPSSTSYPIPSTHPSIRCSQPKNCWWVDKLSAYVQS